jgi:hypothetical protein
MARSSNRRLKLAELAETDDLVTLWHVGGDKPCRGPALKVPSEFLEAEEAPVLPEGCELPDGSKLRAGEALVCGTCGESLAGALASQLALSRGRSRL